MAFALFSMLGPCLSFVSCTYLLPHYLLWYSPTAFKPSWTLFHCHVLKTVVLEFGGKFLPRYVLSCLILLEIRCFHCHIFTSTSLSSLPGPKSSIRQHKTPFSYSLVSGLPFITGCFRRTDGFRSVFHVVPVFIVRVMYLPFITLPSVIFAYSIQT